MHGDTQKLRETFFKAIAILYGNYFIFTNRFQNKLLQKYF
jgi:hypothetical protein